MNIYKWFGKTRRKRFQENIEDDMTNKEIALNIREVHKENKVNC